MDGLDHAHGGSSVSLNVTLIQTSMVCIASSRVGDSTRHTGPFACLLRGFWSKMCTTAGSRNPRDFPEPVSATPMQSRPARQTGQHWACSSGG